MAAPRDLDFVLKSGVDGGLSRVFSKATLNSDRGIRGALSFGGARGRGIGHARVLTLTDGGSTIHVEDVATDGAEWLRVG